MVQTSALEQLPSELYGDIVQHLPHQDIQRTILSLTRALPRAPIPLERLFRNIHLVKPVQVIHFYNRIRKDAEARTWIQNFSLETWSADADVVINILHLLPKLKELRLFMGPNFSPDHLEEIFTNSKEGLELLSLRFRPYVQRATYYQFLAGAYFDSLIFALSQWPASSIPKLSIVQDPLDPSIAPTGKFAQPFVFHRLDPFSTLCRASATATLPYFRLRIPSRQISRFIYQPQQAFPSLKLLDLSTCDVRSADVEAMLGRFSNLQHLILDQCNLITQRELPEGGIDSQWAALGKVMALAGVRRMKDREKKLRLWLEATTGSLEPILDAQQAIQQGKTKKGRRGLATATISLRGTTEPDQTPAFVQGAQTARELGFKPNTKIRVVPPKPGLLSIAVSLPSHANLAQLGPVEIRAEFERGWAEGISQLIAIRNRLRTSWYNGNIKIVHFGGADTGEDASQDDNGDSEYGMLGLKDVDNEEEFSLGTHGDLCPVLCLAGSTRDSDSHAEHCGHVIARGTWNDEL